MDQVTQKLLNVLQYLGVRSDNYFHSEAKANYDPDNSLAYYVDHSRRADFTGPRDREGIPLYNWHGKAHYLPVLSSLYALGHCEQFQHTGKAFHRKELLKIADWFVRTQNKNGAWLHPLPMKKFELAAPFPSAMIQGMAISTLVRAYLLTKNQDYHDCAIRALQPFKIDVSSGGVKTCVDGKPFYEEYPSEKPHHVLNGFIYSIWGLLDLVRLHDITDARSLWEDGIATLTDWLPRFDMGYWSRYHISDGITNPATIPYHKLHIEQLRVMYDITGEAVFMQYANCWEGYLGGRLNALRTLPGKLRWYIAYGR